jgi:hypothetical protein
MIFNKQLYVLDQNTFSQSLSQFTLEVKDCSSLKSDEPNSNTVLLFNGSIIDKSEIEYRKLINTHATYFTIIPDNLDENDVDLYWHMNTTILKESVANEVLSTDKIESFLNVLNTVGKWTTSDIAQYSNENADEYLELNISKPINTFDYKPTDNPFRGGLASGFRGVSEEDEVVYKIKYNPHDKKNMKAVITRFSTKEEEQPFSIVSVGNISNKEELASFYESKQTEIDDFILSKESIGSIAYNEVEIPLSNITNQIGNDLYMVVSYKEGTAVSIFEDDKRLRIDTIDNFVLIRNYATNNILPSSLENYKKFALNIRCAISTDSNQNEVSKRAENYDRFLTDFSKIISKSGNVFLINQLKKDKSSRSILNTFYIYLLEYEKNNKDNYSQLSILLMVLKSTEVEDLHEKFLINFFFYMKNYSINRNHSFLEKFEDYKKQYKISLDTIKSIEKCIGNIDEEQPTGSSRIYDIDYLYWLRSEMLFTECVEHINVIEKKIEESKNHQFSFTDMDNSVLDKYLSVESIEVDSTPSNEVKILTYIHQFLTHPSLLDKKLANKIDTLLILDLLTMFSIQYKANEKNTLTDVKSFIEKNYLTSSVDSQEKEEWRFLVANVLYKLYKSYVKYNENIIAYFDIAEFDNHLSIEFNLTPKNIDDNSFISKVSYKQIDYISTKAAGDKFNKFFVQQSSRYYIELIDKLFTNKDNAIIRNLIDMEDEEKIVNSEQFLELKQILCKGRFSQAKAANGVCFDFLQKLQQ